MFARYVLEQILSGETTENVVEKIHDYLRMIGENVREGKVLMDDFIIFKVGIFSFSYHVELTRKSRSDWGKLLKIIPTQRVSLMCKSPYG